MNQPRKIDSVVIEQLELDCVIGVNPWERLVNQRITIDITMDVDLVTPVAMEEGLRFAIREGGRTVAAGVFTQVDG